MSDDPLDEGVGVRVLEGNALEAGEPEGVDPQEMWSRFITRARLVSPSNRAAMRIVVVGTGLAGAGAAARKRPAQAAARSMRASPSAKSSRLSSTGVACMTVSI